MFIFVILFLITTLNFVSSIGITPGRTSLNFESGFNKDIAFSVINTEHKDMSVVFVVRGDLAEYVTLTQTFSEFSSTDESKSFTYSINIPNKLDKPGLYKTEIVALEMPKDIKEQGTFVGATVAVISQLDIYAPYPNKYVEAEVNAIEANGNVNFIIPVINRGKLDIVSAKAIIDIYTKLNEKVATIETDTDSINSLGRKELSAKWDAKVNPGKYLAQVSIIYDNEVVKLEKEFNVGEALLDILEVNVKDFQLGDIAKFNALVENKWANDLKDVYLNILVYNKDGEIMADFKSPTYNLNSLSKSEMVAYWDTAGVGKGTYEGKLILKYGDKSTERNIELKISDYDLQVVGLTGQVLIKGKGGTLNLNTILILIVGILVVANVIWFVLIKKLLKKKH
jgi:hypothetical protein